MVMLLVMGAGVFIGARLLPEKYQKLNGWFQTLCISVLIFAMGVSLGKRPDLLQELKTLGWLSFLHALIPMAFSILLVFGCSKIVIRRDK